MIDLRLLTLLVVVLAPRLSGGNVVASFINCFDTLTTKGFVVYLAFALTQRCGQFGSVGVIGAAKLWTCQTTLGALHGL